MKKILIVAEHFNGALRLATGSAVGFARRVAAEIGASYEILVLGTSDAAVAKSAASLGASLVLVADAPELREPLADNYGHLVAEVCRQREASIVVSGASTFSKDLLPRAAALLDAGMLSDVVDVRAESGDLLFRRAMYAGNAIATVKLEGPVQFLTVRTSAFTAPENGQAESNVASVEFDSSRFPSQMKFIGRERKAAGRPDPAEARIVVSGGRAIKNAEDFERLVGGLADALGAGVGSSRALVDAGITPNSLQVGQTGKVVAPELYLALGISGAIQHMAGMKDAKVIAAINKDPEASIFEIADYGLVADIYEAVPELISKLKA